MGVVRMSSLGLAAVVLVACGASQSVSVKAGPGLKAEADAVPAEAPPVFYYGMSKSKLEVGDAPHVDSWQAAFEQACPGASPALLAALNADQEAMDWKAKRFDGGRFSLLATLVGERSYTGVARETVEAAPLVREMIARGQALGANLIAAHETKTTTRSGSQFTEHEGRLTALAYGVDCSEPAPEATPQTETKAP